MNTIDFHILLSDLSRVYHAEYKRLQAEYQTQRHMAVKRGSRPKSAATPPG